MPPYTVLWPRRAGVIVTCFAVIVKFTGVAGEAQVVVRPGRKAAERDRELPALSPAARPSAPVKPSPGSSAALAV